MADKEQVIKRLEREIARTDLTDLEWLDCVEVVLLRDALALLKAQEPRVMTLEELEGLQDEDVIYVEVKPLQKPVHDLTCISVEMVRFVEKVQDPATWIELHTTDYTGFYMTRKTTDPNWRVWTSRPDEKRMAETPWN